MPSMVLEYVEDVWKKSFVCGAGVFANGGQIVGEFVFSG